MRFLAMLALSVGVARFEQAPVLSDSRREDLRFLATELPKRHMNAFHSVKKEQFEAAVAKLDKELPTLTDDGFQLRLAQIVAMVDDAHTTVGLDASNHRFIPLGFAALEDGIFLGGSDADHAGLLGSKLESIESTGVDQALTVIGTVIPAENPYWRRAVTPQRFSDASFMHALGLIPSESTVRLTLKKPDGKSETIQVSTVQRVSDKPLVTATPWPPDKTPLRMVDRNKNYWLKMLPERKAVYLAYNSCRENPDDPFSGIVEQAMKAIDGGIADRLILDLRGNGGGNSMVVYPLIKAVKDRPALNRKDRLFVLIGSRTFSSAMMNAQQFRDMTSATLLGEPTGGKPNSYGEVKSFELPNSRLKVYYCTKYFRQLADKDPDAVYPDVRVALSSQAYFRGEDPVLERALSAP